MIHEAPGDTHQRRPWYWCGQGWATRLLIPAALAALVIVQARSFQRTSSATYDEPVYLREGLEVYRQGRFDGFIRPMTPPLPILLGYWTPALCSASVPASPEDLPGLIGLARVTSTILVGVPLVLSVYLWLTLRRGPLAGAVGGGLLALSPNVLAHASLATTDACLALFIIVSLASMRWYRSRPSRGRFLLVGITVGLALASKQSAVFLLPVFAFLAASMALSEGLMAGSTRWKIAVIARAGLQTLAMAVIAFTVNWALYGFATAPVLAPGITHHAFPQLFGVGPLAESLQEFLERFPIPASLNTFLGQIAHGVRSHEAYLLGERSQSGWRCYFPVAYAVKSTPAEILLPVGALALLAMARTRRDPTVRLWLASLAVFSALALTSKINTGIRYILVVYPVLVLCAVESISLAAERCRPALIVVGGLGLALQAISAASIAPHYLSYFNSFAGGPSQGSRYLVDSNLDWGQDLPALKAELERLGARQPLLAYFGMVDPRAYGLRFVPWDDDDEGRIATCDYIALSATWLHGIGIDGDPDSFAAFRPLPFVARAGYSILLYDADNPRVHDALAEARRKLIPNRRSSAGPIGVGAPKRTAHANFYPRY